MTMTMTPQEFLNQIVERFINLRDHGRSNGDQYSVSASSSAGIMRVNYLNFADHCFLTERAYSEALLDIFDASPEGDTPRQILSKAYENSHQRKQDALASGIYKERHVDEVYRAVQETMLAYLERMVQSEVAVP